MKIVELIGPPGLGKTYTVKKLKKYSGYIEPYQVLRNGVFDVSPYKTIENIAHYFFNRPLPKFTKYKHIEDSEQLGVFIDLLRKNLDFEMFLKHVRRLKTELGIIESIKSLYIDKIVLLDEGVSKCVINTLHEKEFCILEHKPDMYVYIKVPAEQIVERILSRKKIIEMHKKKNYQELLEITTKSIEKWDMYSAWLKKNNQNIIVVDSNCTVSEINSMIKRELSL